MQTWRREAQRMHVQRIQACFFFPIAYSSQNSGSRSWLWLPGFFTTLRDLTSSSVLSVSSPLRAPSTPDTLTNHLPHQGLWILSAWNSPSPNTQSLLYEYLILPWIATPKILNYFPRVLFYQFSPKYLFLANKEKIKAKLIKMKQTEFKSNSTKFILC